VGGDREAWLVYDGDCPFCSRYVRLLRLREAVGSVHLINARDGDPIVAALFATGLNLDDGMALKIGSRVYHGADCIHAVALMTGNVGVFNRISGAIFRSPRRARLLYPLLRACRNATLRVLRRRKIGCAASNLF
jgi:predicted DCC family thiol-disulfide oxidoreductase YuxK